MRASRSLCMRSYVATLIVDSVQNLANAWRSEGNPKTEVSYYQGTGDYWSYSFTWCGFCS